MNKVEIVRDAFTSAYGSPDTSTPSSYAGLRFVVVRTVERPWVARGSRWRGNRGGGSVSSRMERRMGMMGALQVEGCARTRDKGVALVRQRGRSRTTGCRFDMYFAQVCLRTIRERQAGGGWTLYSDPAEALEAKGIGA